MNEITQGAFAPSKGGTPKKKANKGKFKKQYKRKTNTTNQSKTRKTEEKSNKSRKIVR